MNWELIQGKWQEYKGQVKQRWNKLTDQDLTVINGRREVLAGKILERSGAKEQIEKEIGDFETTCKAVTPVAVIPVAVIPVAVTPAAGTA
jgi:uncharacterized protein YjbJ (UPF0337 family)